MNSSAARVVSVNTLSRTWVLPLLLSNVQYGIFTLFIGVLMSALSIVYVTNSTRTLNANLQQLAVERAHLHMQANLLQLEKNTWITEARVQDVAIGKLDMAVPKGQSLVIISEK